MNALESFLSKTQRVLDDIEGNPDAQARDIGLRTGIASETIRVCLRSLRAAKKIYISGEVKLKNGYFTHKWQVGNPKTHETEVSAIWADPENKEIQATTDPVFAQNPYLARLYGVNTAAA